MNSKVEKDETSLLFQINIAWSVFTGLINWRGLHLSHIWTIHLYWVYMLRFALGLLYFFRFDFAFLFVKSYVGWEICALASHLVFCFQSEGGVKSLRTWGRGGNFRTGGVTNLGIWGGGIFAGVSNPLHAMMQYNQYKWQPGFVLFCFYYFQNG